MLRLAFGSVLAGLALTVAGCGGSAAEVAGSVPASAALAPADAVAFVTLVTDEGSDQWRNADRLLGLFPDARAELLAGLREELAAEGLSWEDDIAPALGPEVVVVATVDHRPVVLTHPDSQEALSRLLDRSQRKFAIGEIDGWTALASTTGDLTAYRAALARGTLETDEAFVTSFERLPAEALARAWFDPDALADVALTMAPTDPMPPPPAGFEPGESDGWSSSGITTFGLGASEIDLDLESLGVALVAEEDGVLVTVGMRLPDGVGETSYTPELLDRVPADAIAALSFGGTQGTLDRIQDTVDLDALSGQLEDAIGVSFDRVLDALSGEAVVYVRPADGSEIPEVTVALAPPDPDEAFATVDRIAHSLAEQAGATVDAVTVDGRELSRVTVEDVSIVYGRVDDETVIVTTSAEGISDYLGDGDKLASADAFLRAAERVGLDDRTSGFLYVDLDGLIPFVESLAGPEALPAEAREVLTALDAVVLSAEGDGEIVQLTGFVHTTR